MGAPLCSHVGVATCSGRAPGLNLHCAHSSEEHSVTCFFYLTSNKTIGFISVGKHKIVFEFWGPQSLKMKTFEDFFFFGLCPKHISMHVYEYL
jgi:hypothetical protein